jgi:hypothetical protein
MGDWGWKQSLLGRSAELLPRSSSAVRFSSWSEHFYKIVCDCLSWLDHNGMGEVRARMHNRLAVVVGCAALIGCTPPDTAHWPIYLKAPYNTWPPSPPGTPIEPGRAVGLNGHQQETVVAVVLNWMKDPASVHFRGLEAVRNSRGRITVCGEVTGRNSAGNVSTSPFVGVLMGPDADFVLVGIGSSDRERAEVTSLCRANGLYGIQ